MRVLGIECATAACSVALFEGGRLVAGAFEEIGRGHAERLVPLIAQLPDKGRADHIRVSLGPGSFTGIRIGLAAARALALAWRAELAGYPTLALIAAMAREGEGVPISVANTAGHGEWFVQDFDPHGLAETELSSLPPERAAAAARHQVVAGSAADALVRRRGWGRTLPLLPDARRLLLLPAALLTPSLSPLYGRPPDASIPATKPNLVVSERGQQ